MWKVYLKTKIKEASAWIGASVILSTMFLPPIVTMILGLILIFTPDNKVSSFIEGVALKAKEKL